MKTKFFILFMLACTLQAWGQSATITVVENENEDQFEKFHKIRFQFNEMEFTGGDLGGHQVDLKDGFDTGMAIFKKDTIRFQLKFRPDQSYTLKAGCCCAVFTLTADENPQRGSVTVHNRSHQPLTLTIAEANADSIRGNSSSTGLYAFESAMCLFKPAAIQLFENEDGVLLDRTWFHFLHGEKLAVTYDDNTNSVVYKLAGYLTEAEIEAFITRNSSH